MDDPRVREVTSVMHKRVRSLRSVWAPARADVGLLALIVLCGCLLRFAGLPRESIWIDEAISIFTAREGLASIVSVTASDVHPPLYYFVLHVWLTLGESEFAVRALSALFGVLTIVVVYALARELFSSKVGLLSALLLALSPFHIWYSQEARMYTMVGLLALLASYLMLLGLRRQRPLYLVAYALTSALALYTHYFAFLGLLFQGVFLAYWLHKHGGAKREGLRWLLAELAIILMFAPWMPFVYRQIGSPAAVWVEETTGKPELRALWDTWIAFSAYGGKELYPAVALQASCLLYGVALLAAVLGPSSDREREGTLFCVLSTAGPLLTAWLLSQAKPSYTLRYALPFLPPYLVWAAAGIERLRWNWARVAVVGLLAVVLLIGNWNTGHTEQKADWRGATRYLLRNARPGDIVVLLPGKRQLPFDYYARGQIETYVDLPVPVTPETAQRAASDVTLRFLRVWLVSPPGTVADPNDLMQQALASRLDLVGKRHFRRVGDVKLYASR